MRSVIVGLAAVLALALPAVEPAHPALQAAAAVNLDWQQAGLHRVDGWMIAVAAVEAGSHGPAAAQGRAQQAAVRVLLRAAVEQAWSEAWPRLGPLGPRLLPLVDASINAQRLPADPAWAALAVREREALAAIPELEAWLLANTEAAATRPLALAARLRLGLPDRLPQLHRAIQAATVADIAAVTENDPEAGLLLAASFGDVSAARRWLTRLIELDQRREAQAWLICLEAGLATPAGNPLRAHLLSAGLGPQRAAIALGQNDLDVALGSSPIDNSPDPAATLALAGDLDGPSWAVLAQRYRGDQPAVALMAARRAVALGQAEAQTMLDQLQSE